MLAFVPVDLRVRPTFRSDATPLCAFNSAMRSPAELDFCIFILVHIHSYAYSYSAYSLLPDDPSLALRTRHNIADQKFIFIRININKFYIPPIFGSHTDKMASCIRHAHVVLWDSRELDIDNNK